MKRTALEKMSKRLAGRRITIIGTLAYRVIVVALIGRPLQANSSGPGKRFHFRLKRNQRLQFLN